MAKKLAFETRLEKHDEIEATAIVLPFDAKAVFGAKRVPVRGTIKDAPFRSTVFRMSGHYRMAVKRNLRAASGIKPGDNVAVEMEPDLEPHTVEPPLDLLDALNSNQKAKAVWELLTYTHKKEFAQSIEEAKREETRRRRVRKTIAELLSKTSNKTK